MSIIDNSNLNSSQKLYKYMDLEKFLSLIVKGELCFCNQRILKNIDPYEGAITKEELIKETFIKEIIKITKSTNIFKSLKISNGKDTLTIDLNISDIFTIYDDKSYFIDCWHINDYESLAMWKVFSNNKNSIAISTTKAKLIDNIKSYNKEIFLEKVFYSDLKDVSNDIEFDMQINILNDNTLSINSNILYSLCSNNGLLRKTKYFDYEKELRLYFKDDNNSSIVQFIPIELKYIVDEIIISPNCDYWFLDILNNIVEKYKLNIPIRYSDIMENNIKLSKSESETVKKILKTMKFKQVK